MNAGAAAQACHRQLDDEPGDGIPSFGNSGSSASNCSDAEQASDAVLDMISGNKVKREVDFIATGELPLQMVRTYNHLAGSSFINTPGIFGKHWYSSVDMQLGFEYDAASTQQICFEVAPTQSPACGTNRLKAIYARRDDGAIIRFVVNKTSGRYLPEGATNALINVQASPTVARHTDVVLFTKLHSVRFDDFGCRFCH